jgi:hypothetical protein
MKRNTYDYRHEGTPAVGVEDPYAFAQERYRDLLREAEAHRMIPQDPCPRPSSKGQPALHVAHWLNWAKMRWVALTHAA